MEKEFVPYELAFKLKKIGFDKISFKAYGKKYASDKDVFLDRDFCTHNWNEYSGATCSAPLWQQAFDWFWKVKKLYSTINIQSISEGKWSYEILIINEGLYNNDLSCEMDYNSYEEAREACLEKLINLVDERDK